MSGDVGGHTYVESKDGLHPRLGTRHYTTGVRDSSSHVENNWQLTSGTIDVLTRPICLSLMVNFKNFEIFCLIEGIHLYYSKWVTSQSCSSVTETH